MKHLKTTTLSAALLAAFLLAGCGEKNIGKDAYGAKTGVAAEHHDAGGEKLSHFTDRSELFVEFPALVVGQPATFAAHLTWLADFKPFAQGRLTVLLTGANAAEERIVVDAPAVPGIFKPVVTPKFAGERQLTLLVETADGVLTHELGPVQVFTDTKAAQAERHEHGEEGIPFSKEQQWKIDFATTEAVKGIARASVLATGTIRATPDGEALLAAPSAGLLRAAGSFPRVGQAVKKGDVLAWLSPRLGGDTDQATLQAGAGRARIALEQARRERQRMESLFKDEAIAEKRLLEARAGEAMAGAEQHAAERRLAQLGGSAGQPGGIALRAPIDGVIADVSAAAGAFVADGAPLIHIANTGQLWLEVRVPESEIGRLQTPSGASFTVDGFERSFAIESGRNGKLLAIGGVVDATTRTVPLIFEFANPELALRLGMSARVRIYSGAGQEAVLVPASAVQDESGSQVVYVQTGGESFERRLVQTGARDGERIAIVAGLEAGQRVVSKGAYLIRLSTSKAGPAGHAH
jgi:RND family efflux transporter MFP subunit